MPPAISDPVAAVVDRGPSDPQSSAVNDRGYSTSRKIRIPWFAKYLRMVFADFYHKVPIIIVPL